MKNKIIITALFFLFAIGVQAQDKYQFMAIQYYSGIQKIAVSIDGVEHLKEDANPSKDEKGFTMNPLFKKVKEYQDKKWEVMQFSENANLVTAFLRKKIETK